MVDKKGEAEHPNKKVGVIICYLKFSLLIYKGNNVMNKAKIMLSAIAVLGLVGGVFAFKATRSTQPWFRTNGAGNCVVAVQTSLTTDPAFAVEGAIIFTQTSYNLITKSGPCTQTAVFTAL